MALDNLLPQELCEDLILLQDLAGNRGYRPFTEACHISALLASRPHLALPLLKARDLVRDAVHAHFEGNGDFHFEFTGLLTWLVGGEIGNVMTLPPARPLACPLSLSLPLPLSARRGW